MMDRTISTISKQVGELLIEQISHELFNHNLYRSIANFFATEGITDLEEYYIKRANEETLHHQWIVDRLNEADYVFNYPSIDKVTNEFDDYIEPFKLTVSQEIDTTEKITKIARIAFAEDDYQTFTWLQKLLISEQHEEESTSRTALDIMCQDDCNIFTKAKRILNLLNN